MSLIDVVKDSLDANGIDYTCRPIGMPTDIVIAQPEIKGFPMDCFVVVNDSGNIVIAEYILGQANDQAIVDEVRDFMLGVNDILSLGHLFIDDTRTIRYTNALNLDYVADPQKSIAAFIHYGGETAFAFFPYFSSILNGGGSAAAQLCILYRDYKQVSSSTSLIK